jgi:hypothetical protein
VTAPLHGCGETPMVYIVGVMRFNFAASRKEIARGNALRLGAGLLPLDDAEELRRMFQAHQFKRWLKINFELSQRIERKYLERQRRLRKNPNWQPTEMLSGGGLTFYNHMWKVMQRVWIAQRRAAALKPQ